MSFRVNEVNGENLQDPPPSPIKNPGYANGNYSLFYRSKIPALYSLCTAFVSLLIYREDAIWPSELK